ncbi:MAG: AAA family ATPase [Candidatus Eisenbacteria bacterium]|nr:AAA family ATPase [Candidatus Eisenbacteria bacterium]
MNDQAAMLRQARESAWESDAAPETGPDVTVVGSGKGGVGKSTLSVMIAAELARRGRRTLLLDGSQNTGNLHILLGVRPPLALRALLTGEASAHDLLVPLGTHLSLLPADSGAEHLYGLTAVDRARLHHRLSAVYDEFEHVVVDGGPGLESAVRAAGIRASRLVAVATPEPAALADVYALLKITALQLPSVPLEVMVNAVTADEEGQAVFDRLSLAAQRFLHRELGYLGCMSEDENLRRCARRPGALLEERRETIGAIAARLDSATRQDAVSAVGPADKPSRG